MCSLEVEVDSAVFLLVQLGTYSRFPGATARGYCCQIYYIHVRSSIGRHGVGRLVSSRRVTIT
jgi:hypothetical protein